MKSLWQGPMSQKTNGGISYSMLHEFIVCRHDFWLHHVMGLENYLMYDHKMEYGSIFHAGLEGEGKERSRAIDLYCTYLRKRFPDAAEQIAKDKILCQKHLELYDDYWEEEDSDKEWIARETVFCHPYRLPNGCVVYLRGKMDGVFSDEEGGVWLMENKVKGFVDEGFLLKTLHYDLQTQLYMSVLREQYENVKGVLYNVIKRPLGTKSSPRIRKEEGWREFISRIFHTYEGSCEGYPIMDNSDYWFFRWEIELDDLDIRMFRTQCLDRALMDVCDWWLEVKDHPDDPWKSELHRRRPYGVFDSFMFSGSPYLDYLAGPKVGQWPRVERMFPELSH